MARDGARARAPRRVLHARARAGAPRARRVERREREKEWEREREREWEREWERERERGPLQYDSHGRRVDGVAARELRA
jgi:hypothetical protein